MFYFLSDLLCNEVPSTFHTRKPKRTNMEIQLKDFAHVDSSHVTTRHTTLSNPPLTTTLSQKELKRRTVNHATPSSPSPHNNQNVKKVAFHPYENSSSVRSYSSTLSRRKKSIIIVQFTCIVQLHCIHF